MILEVIEAVRHLAPGLLPETDASVACIQTTRPKYLVFGRNAMRPICVVQFGPEQELRRVHDILERLGPHLRGRLAQPLACGAWRGTFAEIQSGLEGSPWFRMQQTCGSAIEWFDLERRALATLRNLQTAVQNAGGYGAAVTPSEELDRQLQQAQAGHALPNDVRERCRSAVAELRDLGTVAGFAQHGDYSLNNLLVGGDGVLRIIDFDEFDLTRMPLHDEAGLALSMHALAPPAAASATIYDHLEATIRPTLREAPALAGHAPNLILHHLLWRINQCAGFARRARVEAWSVDLLCQVCRERRLSALAE